MTGNNATILRPSQMSDFAALLADLDRRGVLFKLCEGVFRYADSKGQLSAGEEIGLDVIRPSLTEYLRLAAGLCIACAGEPKKAVRPNYGPKLRATYPPVWCEACDRAGAWKAGLKY